MKRETEASELGSKMVLLPISLWKECKFVNVIQNICASPFHSFEGFIGWREMNMCWFYLWLLQYHCQWFSTSLFTSTWVSSLRHQSRYFHTSLVTRTPVSLLQTQSHYLNTSISKVYMICASALKKPLKSADDNWCTGILKHIIKADACAVF